MFGFSTVKLIGAGIAALAVLAFIAMAFSWKSDRDKLLNWQGEVVAATAEASGVMDAKGHLLKPKPKDVPEQIRYLGKAIADVKLKTAQAQADDLAHARSVEATNIAKGEQSVAEYQANLAALRSRYDILLRNHQFTGSANSGSSGGKDMSCTSTAARLSCNPAEEGGLSPDDALIASEQGYQLQAILNWARQVGIVRAADPPKPHMHEMQNH